MNETRRLISTGSTFERDLAYSRAVVQGDWCFVSGITGYDYATMRLAAGIAAQAETALATLDRVLIEAGFAMADIVRIQYTLTDAGDVSALAPVLRRFFAEVRPAATMVIAGLIEPEMRFEVEATALKRPVHAA